MKVFTLPRGPYVFHKHHITPKHAGGADDAGNLKRVTVTEHADEHYRLFQVSWGWNDYWAWKTLSGKTPSRANYEEEVRRLSRENLLLRTEHDGSRYNCECPRCKLEREEVAARRAAKQRKRAK